MKITEIKPDDFRKELEALRAQAKTGDPAAQIEIAEKLFAAMEWGVISSREGNGDAFRWVRTAEINPALTDEQRVQLAETLVKHQASHATMRIVTRLLNYVYRYGEDIIKGHVALTLGKAHNRSLFDLFRRRGHLKWIKETSRDIARSLVWFRRAAHCGKAMGAIYLYESYLCGTGVLANRDKALYWKNRAQELIGRESLSQFAAQTRMENVESRRCIIQKDFESAREQLFQAESEESVRQAMGKLQECANEGYAPAMALWCAEILDTGQKTAYAMAKLFLRDAVRQGYPAALAIAGRWLLTGGRGVQQDIKLARQLLNRAAPLEPIKPMDNVNAYALALQCRCALQGWGKNKYPIQAEATDLWKLAEKRAMEQQDGQALYELFLLGKVLLIDSFYLIRAAAEAGNVRACFELGRRYSRGMDVPVDREEAQFWHQKAAFRGYQPAQYVYLLGLKPWLSSTDDEKNRFFLRLEKSVQAGNTHAGIRLGECRTFVETTGIRKNWQEGERLFRRFCPLAPQRGYTDRIINHFLEKPATKRSDRDQRFLDRARDYLRDNDPERAARLFQMEAPDFATECAALAGEKTLGKDDILIRAKELETSLSKAETDWISENEELRRRSGTTFIKWARYLSSLEGRDFARSVQKPMHQLNAEDMVALVARCCWRAAQTLLLEHDLTTDTKKSIDCWIQISLKPYRMHMDDSMDSTSCPDFVREVAFFCCRNTNQMQELGLSFNTIVLGHEVAALRFDDKTALKWLIENNANEHLRRSRTRIYLQKAVDEKIPLALRLEADRISSKSFISPKAQQKAQAEIAQLLQEAAEGGDAEAQCRQGETLLRNKTPEDWRHRTCEWFLKAANQGHERATVHLGQLFAEEKPMEAIRWLKQVAENPEADASLRASAECELGKLYLRRQQLADAANHLRTAAQNNNRAAMKLLALEPNLRGTLSDEEIQKWCLSLLKQKETDGQDDKSFRSQVLTRLGQVAKSKTERADWFRQAAEAGDGPGAYEWARCLLFDGKLQEANTWFQEAQKRCQDHLDGNRDLAAQAEAWHNCVYSMISEPIPPVPAQKRRELFIKTEPRP